MKLRKVKNQNLYYVNDSLGKRVAGPFPKHVAQNMIGGAEPDTSAEPVADPQLQALIDKAIEQQTQALRVGALATPPLVGKGSLDPDDDEPESDTPAGKEQEPIDQDFIINYTQIQQENETKQNILTSIGKLCEQISTILQPLENYTSYYSGNLQGQLEEYKLEYMYSQILLAIAQSEVAPQQAKTEYQATQNVNPSPTKYKKLFQILNNFSPIPGLKINWRNFLFRMNPLDQQDLLKKIFSATGPSSLIELSPELALTPYPTRENTDPNDLTNVYLAQMANLDIRQSAEGRKTMAADRMLRLILRANYPFTDEQTRKGINGVYFATYEDNIKKRAQRAKSFQEVAGIYREFQINDPDVDKFLNEINSTSKTYNTDDDVEFFKDRRIEKYDWTLGDKIQETIAGLGALLSESIPVIGPIVAAGISAVLSPIAAISFASRGNGSDAIVMLSTFAKALPGINVAYSVSSILDKLVKKQPITDDDKTLLADSVQSTLETLATGVGSAIVKNGLSRTIRADVLKSLALKSLKNGIKNKLFEAITNSSEAELDHQASKIFVAHNISADDSHIAGDNQFYYINDIGTGNQYFYYLFPDEPIPEEVQDMVDTPPLDSTGGQIYIIPPESIFIDAINDYTPKTMDAYSILFRKLAFQNSEYFKNEIYRIQTATRQYYKQIATQLERNLAEDERSPFLEYIKEEYFTEDNIKQIRMDGIDLTKPDLLQLPLVIPRPDFELASSAAKQLSNTIYRNMTKYLQDLVDEEQQFVDDTMTYIESYGDTIISQTITELIKEQGDKSAQFSTELYDKIYTTAGNAFTNIIDDDEMPHFVIEAINKIKEESGDFIGTFPPITQDLTGGAEPSIADHLKSDALYHLKDLLNKTIVDAVPQLAITYGTTGTIGESGSYIKAKNQIVIDQNMGQLKAQTLAAIEPYYATRLNNLKSNFIYTYGPDIAFYKIYTNSKALSTFDPYNYYNSGNIMYGPNELLKGAKTNWSVALPYFQTGKPLDPTIFTDFKVPFGQKLDFVAKLVRAAYLSQNRGYMDDLWNLTLADKQRLIDNITNNPVVNGDNQITESYSDLESRVKAYNDAYRSINIKQQQDAILNGVTRFNVTENDIKVFSTIISGDFAKPGFGPVTLSVDIPGLIRAVEQREASTLPSTSGVKFIPMTNFDLLFTGPSLVNGKLIPNTYNRFAYIGQERIEIDKLYDTAYNAYIRTTRTPLSRTQYITQNAANFKTQLDAIKDKYEALRNGNITIKELPKPLPPYTPPEIDEPEPEPEEEEEEEKEEEEEEEEQVLNPEQLALYKQTFNNSISSLITYLLSQKKVDDSEQFSDLYDFFNNYKGEITQDIIDALLELYSYEQGLDNNFTIRHYIHPILWLLQQMQIEDADENIQEEDERQVEDMIKKLKKYKYSNPKFNAFDKDEVSVLDILKAFPDIKALVKLHPNIIEDDLSEMEAKIPLNKSFAKTKPSQVTPFVLPPIQITPQRGFASFGQ